MNPSNTGHGGQNPSVNSKKKPDSEEEEEEGGGGGGGGGGDSYSIRQQRSFPCVYWDGCM